MPASMQQVFQNIKVLLISGPFDFRKITQIILIKSLKLIVVCKRTKVLVVLLLILEILVVQIFGMNKIKLKCNQLNLSGKCNMGQVLNNKTKCKKLCVLK